MGRPCRAARLERVPPHRLARSRPERRRKQSSGG
jgi:hypothetical protein